MAEQKRSAGFTIHIGTDEVGCVTGWELGLEANEEEISCLSDTVGNPPVIEEKYIVTSVNKTAALNGVSLFDDAGQNALFTAANTGATVSLEYRYYDGSGFDLEGQFQSFSLTGSKDQFAETFTGQFRVNELTEVSAGG